MWKMRFAIVSLLFFVPALGRAAEPTLSATSLGKVPSDAEAYCSFLRLGETIDTIAKSRAWKMVWDHPAVRKAWKEGREAYEQEDGDWSAFRTFLNDPANKELTALATDALSQEIFVYAGSGWGDVIALVQELYGSVYFGAVRQGFSGKMDESANLKQLVKSIVAQRERLRIPDLVVGFKVSDPQKVTAQLKRLDPLLADALKDIPLKGRSERVKVGGDEFLVLKLDGSLIPFDLIMDKKEEIAPIIEVVKKMKLKIAVGVRQGYLLIAVGESVDHLAKFGKEGQSLAQRPEFKPLAKAAGRPITSIGFTSEKLRQAVTSKPEDYAGVAEFIMSALKEAKVPEPLSKSIEKDIDAFIKEQSKKFRKPGASMDFSFRTRNGWESYDYDYTDPGPGQSRPLSLLEHLGGNPLMAGVWRSDTTLEDYQDLVKWAKIFGQHAIDAVEAVAPDQKEKFKEIRDQVIPILKELSDVTEKYWLPALADGQEGFVLDGKWSSKSWLAFVPAADADLHLPEIGIVLGISDAGKFEKALEGYRVALNKVIAKVRGQLPAGQLNDVEIPKPKVEQDGGDTYAHYPLPQGLGVDSQFRPTGGLSKRVAVVTLSKAHADRLLNQFPLKVDSTLLSDPTRPMDSMFYMNWAGIVEMATPWIPYLKTIGVVSDVETGQFAIKLLKTLRTYTSVTYRERGATVTRSEAVFRDVPEK